MHSRSAKQRAFRPARWFDRWEAGGRSGHRRTPFERRGRSAGSAPAGAACSQSARHERRSGCGRALRPGARWLRPPEGSERLRRSGRRLARVYGPRGDGRRALRPSAAMPVEALGPVRVSPLREAARDERRLDRLAEANRLVRPWTLRCRKAPPERCSQPTFPAALQKAAMRQSHETGLRRRVHQRLRRQFERLPPGPRCRFRSNSPAAYGGGPRNREVRLDRREVPASAGCAYSRNASELASAVAASMPSLRLKSRATWRAYAVASAARP